MYFLKFKKKFLLCVIIKIIYQKDLLCILKFIIFFNELIRSESIISQTNTHEKHNFIKLYFKLILFYFIRPNITDQFHNPFERNVCT